MCNVVEDGDEQIGSFLSNNCVRVVALSVLLCGVVHWRGLRWRGPSNGHFYLIPKVGRRER